MRVLEPHVLPRGVVHPFRQGVVVDLRADFGKLAVPLRLGARPAACGVGDAARCELVQRVDLGAKVFVCRRRRRVVVKQMLYRHDAGVVLNRASHVSRNLLPCVAVVAQPVLVPVRIDGGWKPYLRAVDVDVGVQHTRVARHL